MISFFRNFKTHDQLEEERELPNNIPIKRTIKTFCQKESATPNHDKTIPNSHACSVTIPIPNRMNKKAIKTSCGTVIPSDHLRDI